MLPLYLVCANVLKVTQWVVKTTLHDTEVLVQFVHDVRAVAVQLASIRLLPRGTFDCQRRPQLFELKLYCTDSQRPCQLANLILQALQSANTRQNTSIKPQ